MVDFWAITCSIIILYFFFKPKEDLSRDTVRNRWARKRLDRQRKQEADDLITMIIPTINSDENSVSDVNREYFK